MRGGAFVAVVVLIAGFGFVLVSSPTDASHTPNGQCECEDFCPNTIVLIETGAGRWYVDDRVQFFQVANGAWVYEESNGISTPQPPGVSLISGYNHELQRGGTALLGGQTDYCVDEPAVPSDLLISGYR